MAESMDPLNPVLIVDDEPFILRTTAAMLSRLGFAQVETADNVAAAMEIIASANPTIDLVLSDLNMPDADGLELLRRFDEMGYRGDILLFSGEDRQTLKMAESLARARGLSVLGTIAKPVQADRLMELLSRRSNSAKLSERPLDGGVLVTPDMLEEAIDTGELQPWFQPKIDVANRTPVGVEALARWPDSGHGPIFPDAFIPIAETYGLINKLTFSLIEQAIATQKMWHLQGIELELAFNISMNSLQDDNFTDELENRIAAANGNFSQIKLEVTESQLMEDLVRPLEALLRLRMKKVKLSIDDFGTGHSNLSQLRDLPFDELKLDRSYVSLDGNGERTGLILESSVEMARKLGMSIVAEGVETLEEWRRIEQLGCNQVQGYYTAKPMPGDDIPEWIAAWPTLRDRLFDG
jgi:EAL domain-containing protein (putative c-di-GMP-specific phosphodiesterase class I)/ActR/RegA family two-component response regulator